MNIGEILKQAELRLSKVSDSARLDAELLLGFVLNKSRASLFAWSDAVPAESELQSFNKLLVRRENGEPVAYLLGEQEFWSLKLKVTPDVLIPRPETELLVEKALELLPKDKEQHVADLGTGSGAIALAIASERPLVHMLGIDLSRAALQVAKENAIVLKIDNISFKQGRWMSSLEDASLDMVVSNPPYIAEKDPHLQQGDVRFEPTAALVSGEDGLDDIRLITHQAMRVLKDDGWLLVEHGWDQGQAVQGIIKKTGLKHCQLLKDLSGNDRVSLGQKCGE